MGGKNTSSCGVERAYGMTGSVPLTSDHCFILSRRLVYKGSHWRCKMARYSFFAQVRASPSELDWEASQVGSESSLSLLWGRPDKQLDPGKLCPFSVLYLPPWLSWCLQNSCLFPEVNFNCGAFKHFKRWRARKSLNEALGENKC